MDGAFSADDAGGSSSGTTLVLSALHDALACQEFSISMHASQYGSRWMDYLRDDVNGLVASVSAASSC
jgi:hypothetical protein